MRLIGDPPLFCIGIPSNVGFTDAERDRIERDFPEAGFIFGLGGY
jgi:hypothetical protein